jgi:hypothetical protein
MPRIFRHSLQVSKWWRENWYSVSRFSYVISVLCGSVDKSLQSHLSPCSYLFLDFLTALSSNWLNYLILGCPVCLFPVNFNPIALVCYFSYQQSIRLSCWYICGRHCVLSAATRQLLPQFCIRRFPVPFLQYRLTNLTDNLYGFHWSVQGTPETVPQIRLLFLIHFINLLLGDM